MDCTRRAITTIAVLFACGSALAAPAFVDVAPTSGLTFTCQYGPPFAGNLNPIDITMQQNMGNGIAVGDYDRDGDLDVLMLSGLTHVNRLFRNDLDTGSKSFTDVTASAGVGDAGLGRVAHFADLDNDGWLDLVVVNDDDGEPETPPSRIYRNNRDGTFADVSAASGFRPVGYLLCGAALADFDRDGLLDIVITSWKLPYRQFVAANFAYRNLGGFQFEPVTSAVGLDAIDANNYSPILHDFDGDHWPDLFVAVDFESDFFFRNVNGVFVDQTIATGCTHTGNDMGAACADFDDDGDLDLYTTNITDLSVPGFGYPTDGNCLYVNDAGGVGLPQFTDEAEIRSCVDTYWGWGTAFVDVENDGDLDIVAANGFDERVGDLLPNSPILQTPTVLFQNDGAGFFSRNMAPGLEPGEDSRALIAFDYDRDGDQDLLIGNLNAPVRLLENVTPATGHWLGVRLVQGPGRLRNAVGATVRVRIGSVTKRREIMRGGSYLSGGPAEAHFGLGAADVIDELTVTWPDGATTSWSNVSVDQWITLSRVEGDCDADGALDGADIHGFVQRLLGGAAPLCLEFGDAGESVSEQVIAFIDAMIR